MSWRAWTPSAARITRLRGNKRKPPEPIKKWKIVRGDLVEILSGKDKGKQGLVSVVARKRNWVFVEGLNTHIRVLPPVGEFPGGRIAAEAPLHVSNVALVDPSDHKPCRIRYKYIEDGEKVRVSKRTGAIIPKSPDLKRTSDSEPRTGYEDGPKDTKASVVAAKTYIPGLLTFEEEISKGLELMKLAARTSAVSKS